MKSTEDVRLLAAVPIMKENAIRNDAKVTLSDTTSAPQMDNHTNCSTGIGDAGSGIRDAGYNGMRCGFRDMGSSKNTNGKEQVGYGTWDRLERNCVLKGATTGRRER